MKSQGPLLWSATAALYVNQVMMHVILVGGILIRMRKVGAVRKQEAEGKGHLLFPENIHM